jgi:dolichol-phosphate mannosyltransferase
MISIVVPVYNESGNITPLFNDLLEVGKYLDQAVEVIFVNDGSSDDSQTELNELTTSHPEAKFVRFTRNFGHQIAVMAGLEHARGEYIVLIDADGQDPPSLIKDLYEKLLTGYDIVYAQRESRKGESWLKKATAKWFYRILDKITDIPIPKDTGDFRIMTAKVRDSLINMKEQHKFLRGQMAWLGFKQTSVLYQREERRGGETGYSFRKMLRFALDGITSFSRMPLRIATMMGFVCAIIGLVLIIYTLYSRFILKSYEPGWASLMITIVFLGGIQLLSVGVIGEYISRMNDNIRNRPLYVIEETNIEDD